MYILVRDDDAHWYVISADRQDEWYDHLEDTINDLDPDHPDWAVIVGGSPSLVKFPSFSIGE